MIELHRPMEGRKDCKPHNIRDTGAERDNKRNKKRNSWDDEIEIRKDDEIKLGSDGSVAEISSSKAQQIRSTASY